MREYWNVDIAFMESVYRDGGIEDIFVRCVEIQWVEENDDSDRDLIGGAIDY
jgi:hypothetical protein